jgi:preprotein translocase subunit SecE
MGGPSVFTQSRTGDTALRCLKCGRFARISTRKIKIGTLMATKTSPTQFIAQVRAEVAKVVWPTRREVLLTTIMVFIMAALTATFFSLVDMAIRFGLKLIIGGV